MKRLLLVLLTLCTTTALLQSCKKNEANPTPASVNPTITDTGAISKSTGLRLNGVGDFGIFQVLNDAGNTTGIPGFTNNNNDTVAIDGYEGTAYQKWRITDSGEGNYTIMNVGSGKYIEAGSNGQLIQNQATGQPAQLWVLTKLTDKAYKAISKSTGLSVTSVGNGVKLAAYNNLPTQMWGYNQVEDRAVATNFLVNGLLQSNMVVQRGKPFPVWGKTNAGATVSVKAGWNATLFTTKADAGGNWKLFIPAAEANSTEQTLTCSTNGPKPVKFTGVLIGDVWLCSGQSNMTMPMNRQDNNFGGFHGVADYENEIAAANYPLIRMMPVRIASNKTPMEELTNPGTWVVCTPANAAKNNFSATAYYFARRVHISSPGNVPVGVIVSGVGATYIEQWSSAETIAKDPITQSFYAGKHNSSQLYNAMIYPLKNLPIKGFIWYQGEQNASDIPASNYTLLNRNMIHDWRTLFNQGTLPFYFVQIPPLGTLFADEARFGNALFREAQANVRTVEKTGMACVMDTDEPFNIHNIYKQPVGDRLGLLALQNDYGRAVNAVGPQYVSYSQNGNTVTVILKNGEGLIDKDIKKPVWFFVASATDKKFLRATNVVVSDNKVQFTVPVNGMKVDAIRYAFIEIAVTHITNSLGLPMEPFRTDNW
ncbi:MAG: hypothetical protein EOP51_23970 [Sphingobacteriales bacterium]|nr:MAG: hypothetical protein EOP51_23970 [Sphingobacteriales bacterium]